jgi:hypothetical protein
MECYLEAKTLLVTMLWISITEYPKKQVNTITIYHFMKHWFAKVLKNLQVGKSEFNS